MSSTYRRMNIAGSAETRSDSGVIELTGRPSEAFFESLRQAERQKAEYPNDREELLASVRGPQDIGLRTLLSAICMIVVGVTLFITGLVIYTNSKRGDAHNGLEILVTGTVLLLPGAYAGTIIYGYVKKWRGYEIEHLPSYDQ